METGNNNSAVRINSIDVIPIIYRGQRVLTLAQIDKIHERPTGTASRNFQENKSRMTEGEDFYLVDFSQNNVFRLFGIEIPPRGLTVVTESGYLLLVKSFTDDLAWQIQRILVKAYFRVALQPANHSINDPIIAALVQGLVEIDALKQQQAAIVRKTEQLESRVENVELQHRNGVPKGYLSRSQAQAAYGLGLSKEVFFLALRQLKVPTTSYIHHGEDGNDVATFAYLESDIADAVQAFLADSFQATPCMCESPLLNGKRFRYLKTSASDQALKKR
jgi:hypothetical protein